MGSTGKGIGSYIAVYGTGWEIVILGIIGVIYFIYHIKKLREKNMPKEKIHVDYCTLIFAFEAIVYGVYKMYPNSFCYMINKDYICIFSMIVLMIAIWKLDLGTEKVYLLKKDIKNAAKTRKDRWKTWILLGIILALIIVQMFIIFVLK